jgi:branched-chain amino acid transport system ATP-binding protein
MRPKKGQVIFNGTPISGLKPHEISRMNLAYVSESLNLFTNMTVADNLMLGAYSVRDKAQRDQNLDFVYELFPRLKERAGQLAGTMSGGERKMLAIARAIMASPRAMLIDEPSLGLAPHLAHEVFQGLVTLNKRAVTILLVEQNVHMTLEITSRAYVIEHGRVVMEGPSPELAQNEHVRKAYLGL